MRIVTALIFLAHGTMKLLGWPALPSELAAMLQPGSLMWWSGVLEAAFGPFLLIGLFTRPVAFLASGEMAIGYFVIHAPHSVWPAINEGDAAVLYTFVFLLLAAAGPGAWSLDARVAKRRRRRGSHRLQAVDVVPHLGDHHRPLPHGRGHALDRA